MHVILKNKFFQTILCLFILTSLNAQLKNHTISVKGDTLNVIDEDGVKQGKWVVHVDPLRGERGYEEEGIFVDGKKEGLWRKYTLQGDLLSIETYRFGGKDGASQYFTAFGDLVREENWRGYNPNSPYDTIPIYGTESNQILSYKIVKAEPYSVKHGTWTYYDKETGRIAKTEEYDRNRLLSGPKKETAAAEKPKYEKPMEVVEYEKKMAGKKKVKVRDGQTR